MVAPVSTKKTTKSKPAKKAVNGTAKTYEVITLRIGKPDKAQLLAYCAKRAKAQGSQMSFNKAIIELIHAA